MKFVNIEQKKMTLILLVMRKHVMKTKHCLIGQRSHEIKISVNIKE